MGEPLYRNKALWRQDFRIIWWMLANQVVREGVPTGELESGWRAKARAEFKMNRQTLYAHERRLRAAGVIDSLPYSRAVRLVAEAFLG